MAGEPRCAICRRELREAWLDPIWALQACPSCRRIRTWWLVTRRQAHPERDRLDADALAVWILAEYLKWLVTDPPRASRAPPTA